MPQGGRYFLCDRCQVTTFSLNLPWSRDNETVAAARRAGWKVGIKQNFLDERGEDVCPLCLELDKQPDTGGRR